MFNWERFKRATNDGFFLVIEARDPRFTELEARALLDAKRRPAHHHDSRRLTYAARLLPHFSPDRRSRWSRVFGFRGQNSTGSPIEIFPDMVRQPKVPRPGAARIFLPIAAAPARRSRERFRSATKCRKPQTIATPAANVPGEMNLHPRLGFSEGTDYYNTGKMGDELGDRNSDGSERGS